MEEKILVEAINLKKYFKVGASQLHAVDGINFRIRQGTTLGVVSVSQKRHALGGTHFCPHARDRNSFPLISPWGQNLALNRALAAKRLAHSQRQISLYVSRPFAHVGWTGLF